MTWFNRLMMIVRKKTLHEFGFVYVERVGKYTFASPTINEAPFGDSNVLVIEDRKRVPDNVKILKKFNLLNGETILVGYTF
jgi:hypothetical protein